MVAGCGFVGVQAADFGDYRRSRSKTADPAPGRSAAMAGPSRRVQERPEGVLTGREQVPRDGGEGVVPLVVRPDMVVRGPSAGPPSGTDPSSPLAVAVAWLWSAVPVLEPVLRRIRISLPSARQGSGAYCCGSLFTPLIGSRQLK